MNILIDKILRGSALLLFLLFLDSTLIHASITQEPQEQKKNYKELLKEADYYQVKDQIEKVKEEIKKYFKNSDPTKEEREKLIDKLQSLCDKKDKIEKWCWEQSNNEPCEQNNQQQKKNTIYQKTSLFFYNIYYCVVHAVLQVISLFFWSVYNNTIYTLFLYIENYFTPSKQKKEEEELE